MIKIWSLRDGICQRSLACRSKPLAVAFTSEGQFIVSAHFDGSLSVFEVSSGSLMQQIKHAHMREAIAVASMPHPARVVSVGRDSFVTFSDVHEGKVRLRHSVLQHYAPSHLSF
jgi:WD40 repeat protein